MFGMEKDFTIVDQIVYWSVFVLHSLTQFFERARGMEFFKTIIQIPDLPNVRLTHKYLIEFLNHKML